MGNSTDVWYEIKTLVETIDTDVTKFGKGNASAGVRTRKGLRLLRIKATELLKSTLEKKSEVSTATT